MGAWRKPAAWKRRRISLLLERDGDSCWLCSLPLSRDATRPGRRISIEHLIPRSAGGGDGLDNLVLCHQACNGHLKDRPAARKWQMREKWHREAERVRRRSARRAGRRRRAAAARASRPAGESDRLADPGSRDR